MFENELNIKLSSNNSPYYFDRPGLSKLFWKWYWHLTALVWYDSVIVKLANEIE